MIAALYVQADGVYAGLKPFVWASQSTVSLESLTRGVSGRRPFVHRTQPGWQPNGVSASHGPATAVTPSGIAGSSVMVA